MEEIEEMTFRVENIVRLWHNCDITTEYAADSLASVFRRAVMLPTGDPSTICASLLDEIFRLHALSLDALLTMAVNDA